MKDKNHSEVMAAPSNFIRTKIVEDIKSHKNDGKVATRFPPEPNGYLHIGHAKSICLNFGLAKEFNGTCNIRFDDTNPVKESTEFVDAIKSDISWLGFNWEDREYYASDYFERLFEYALKLINMGKAYVDSLSADEIRTYRGTLTEPGKNSPYRDRSIEENLDLFNRMNAGEFDEGAHVLRAKIDMTHPNMSMRDPTIYRIRKSHHHRTANQWCIYPMYDFTHCISDSIEEITHSLCSLEFENNRPLYDWVLNTLKTPSHPQQIEFARMNLSYTVLSKRKLIALVEEGIVEDWDDPRMPTISGFRRRGYTPASIRAFCERIGVAKRDSVVDISLLEHAIREELNTTAPRVLGVLKPLKVVIENYPEDQVEAFDAMNHPGDTSMGTRKIPFSRVLYIEKDDFMENPPKKFFRLGIGREVRLRYAYYITCKDVVRDENSGEVIELRCTYDPLTKGGSSPDGRKVKGTIHWVSASHAIDATVNLYDRLFTKPNPLEKEEGKDFKSFINPNSTEVLRHCKLEPELEKADGEIRYQFERQGYFCLDGKTSTPNHPIFNRIVTLRDSWAKVNKKK